MADSVAFQASTISSGTCLPATSQTSAVVFEDVSKSYKQLSLFGTGRQTIALRSVSFSVACGETVGLLGPNGAGKTTLLKILTTLVTPTTGRVFVNGFDVSTHSAAARRSIGLVTCDERSFYWRLSAHHNLSFFGTLYGLSKRQCNDRIDELLAALDLTEAAHRPYQEFSAGMKQKLAIARGLLAEPKVVLYDEPTRSLDPLSSQNIRRWIIENRKRHPLQTHIVATHQLSEAEELCDRVLILNKGRILTQGLVDDIRRRFHTRKINVHRLRVSGSASVPSSVSNGRSNYEIFEEPARDGARSLEIHAVPDSDGLNRALESILAAGLTIESCNNLEAGFDEVFCSMILNDRIPAEQP